MSIVITGTPGVGKHTTASRLADELKLPVIDVNRIVTESGLAEPGGDVDVSKLCKILGKSCGSGLVVGHLAPYALTPEQVRLVIVLRRNPYELLLTYGDRGYSDAKSRENSGSEILGVVFHDARVRFGSKVFQVDSTEEDRTQQKVMDVIRGRRGDEQVDWLGLVAGNGDLSKFFSY